MKEFRRLLRISCIVAGLGLLLKLATLNGPWLEAGAGLTKMKGAHSETKNSERDSALVLAAPATLALPQFGLDDGGRLSGQPVSIALAQGTGTFWIRTSVNWSSVEPTEGNFDWSSLDTALSSLTGAGFGPEVYVAHNPSWAANTPCGPIYDAKMSAFSTFIQTLASRYPNVSLWALYNEVDNADYVRNGYSSDGCFGDDVTGDINNNGKPDSADYADMLATAWTAVHQGNPAGQLSMGAVAFDGFDGVTCPIGYPGNCNAPGHFNYNFLHELFNYIKTHPLSSGQQYMDMVLFNYYDLYSTWWESQASGKGIQAKAAAIGQQMTSYASLTWPMFVSETGEDSSSNWAGKGGQARCLDLVMTRGIAADLHGIIWWTFQDNPGAGWYYGIVDGNLVPKPSYSAYKTLTQQLRGYQYSQALSGTLGFASLEAYAFSNGSQTKTLLWSGDPNPSSQSGPPCAWARATHTATFGPGANYLRVADMYGNQTTFTDNGPNDLDGRSGYIGIAVDGMPRYVLVNPPSYLPMVSRP